jgi:hypothetical protein
VAAFLEGKMGRPVEYTPERIADILSKLTEYMENTEIPILAEFAYMNNIPRQALYEHPEFSDARKEIISKKEAQLERLALTGDINTTMAVFSLKQLGWSDKQERILKTIDDEGNETGFKLVAPPGGNDG